MYCAVDVSITHAHVMLFPFCDLSVTPSAVPADIATAICAVYSRKVSAVCSLSILSNFVLHLAGVMGVLGIVVNSCWLGRYYLHMLGAVVLIATLWAYRGGMVGTPSQAFKRRISPVVGLCLVHLIFVPFACL